MLPWEHTFIVSRTHMGTGVNGFGVTNLPQTHIVNESSQQVSCTKIYAPVGAHIHRVQNTYGYWCQWFRGKRVQTIKQTRAVYQGKNTRNSVRGSIKSGKVKKRIGEGINTKL